MDPNSNNTNPPQAPLTAGFASAETTPPPAQPTPPTPQPPTASQSPLPPASQGAPTVTSGGGGKKKIIVAVVILLILSALGVGAYFVANQFLQDPGVTPEPTPIAQDEVTAICLNIKAYDQEWNRLSLTELSSLKPGDVIRLTVAGDTSSGNFDMARFSVNSISLGETTQIKPDSNEFYDEYIIPEGTESFSVEAQIHHQQLDQWI